MHNFKKPSDGKWWWQCFQDFSESQTNTKCIKTAQICGDAYAMKGTFRVTGRQLHLESEGSGILIATICNPRHGSNMPMKWSFKCQMGTTEIFFLCDSTSYFSLPLQTAHVRHSWSLGQGQFGWKKRVLKLSQYKHDYSMTGYKDTPEPWYLNSIAISKSTHQLMAN